MGGEAVHALGARALWWGAGRALIVADLHLGKCAHFRSLGVPAPLGSAEETLGRLGGLIEAFGAERVVVLGDLLHSGRWRDGETVAAVDRWMAARNRPEVMLIEGNHDRAAGELPSAWGVEVARGPHEFGPFALCHDPREGEGARKYALAGHIHPVARLYDRAGHGLRLPCFVVGPRAAVLPAFGAFTGGEPVRPRRGERVIVAGPDGVMEATPGAGRSLADG